ncbi:MAG: TraB/GumN family protein [Bacteroidia bacterium]
MKYLSLTLLFISTLTLAQNSLLYEISGNGVDENSYLMGTVHVQDEKVFNWNDSVFWAMDQAQVAAFELDMSKALDLNLGEDEKAALTNFIFEDFIPKLMSSVPADSLGTRAARDLVPFYKSLLSEQMNVNNRKDFVDQFLQNYCRKQGVKIIGLESTQEQLNAIIGSDFEGLSDNLLGFFEKDNWQLEFEKSIEDQYALIDAYANHEYNAVCEIMSRTVSVSNNFLLNLYDRLLTNRNQIMYDRTKDLVSNGSAFIAVGCGHLCGANGLVQQYRNAGYTVRPMNIRPTSDEFHLEWKTYKGDGFTVDIPVQADSIEEFTFSFFSTFLNDEIASNTIYTSKGVATFKVEVLVAATEAVEDMDYFYDDSVDAVIDYNTDYEEAVQTEEDVVIEYVGEEVEDYEEAAASDDDVIIDYVGDEVEHEEEYEEVDVIYEEEYSEEEIIYIDGGEEAEEIEYNSNRSIIPGLDHPNITEEMNTYMEAVVGSFMAESMKSGSNVMGLLNNMQKPGESDTLMLNINGSEQAVVRNIELLNSRMTCTLETQDQVYYEITLTGDASALKSEEFQRFFTSFKITP